MAFLKVVVTVLAVIAIVQVHSKPSHPFDHFNHWLPGHEFPLAAPAAFLPPPAAPLHFPGPAPLLPHIHAPVVQAPLLAAAAPAPVPAPFHAPVPAPLPVPVPVPVAAPVPTYRAIPGPAATTHHVSVGYALPPPPVFSKVLAHHHHIPHAHLHHHVAPSFHHWAFAKHAIF